MSKKKLSKYERDLVIFAVRVKQATSSVGDFVKWDNPGYEVEALLESGSACQEKDAVAKIGPVVEYILTHWDISKPSSLIGSSGAEDSFIWFAAQLHTTYGVYRFSVICGKWAYDTVEAYGYTMEQAEIIFSGQKTETLILDF